MTPLQLIGAIAVNLLRGSNDKLDLKTVQSWIKDHSDRERHGAGYTGNRLSRGPNNGFIEVVKRPMSNGKSNVTATVYFDPRQRAAASKTWDAKKLDSGLEKFFGKNLRGRIDV